MILQFIWLGASWVAQVVKNPLANAGDASSIPELGRSPVFLPGKFHGQRSLAGYSPWGHKVGHNLATKDTHVVRSPRMSYLSLLLSVSPRCNSGVGRATFFSGVHDILLS